MRFLILETISLGYAQAKHFIRNSVFSLQDQHAMKRARAFESSRKNEPGLFEPSHNYKPISVPIPQVLPALPPIKDQSILSSILTHQGTVPSSQNHLQSASYERYEFLGDAYLELIARELLSARFTEHTVGRLNQLKEVLVKNKTLARFTIRYKIDKMAKFPSNITEASREKICGDLFEAYLAGVILSDSKNGMEVARTWLGALWEPFLRQTETLSMASQAVAQKTTAQAREKNAKSQAEARGAKEQAKLQNTKARLGAQNTEAQVRVPDTDTQAVPQNTKVDTRVANGSSKDAKELLNTRLGGKGVRLEYKDEREPLRLSPSEVKYFIAVYLTGWGRDNHLLGIGSGLNKREASQNAAASALSNHSLVDDIASIKQKHVEKVVKEREAKAAKNGRTYEEQIRSERKATADRKAQAKAEAAQEKAELADLNVGSNGESSQAPRGGGDNDAERQQPSKKRQRISGNNSSGHTVDTAQLPWMRG